MVKVLTGAVDQQRFEEAVVVARRCTHPNVAELVSGGVTSDGACYLVHPYIEGAPLTQLTAQGPLRPERALGLAVQLLRAVCRIHDFGAVHGNVRPSNIIVSNGDHVDVVDVGLGRSLMRDPWDDDPDSLRAQRYLAPELSSQQRLSLGADLYAVGVILYELLTGNVPYDGGNVSDLRNKINEGGTMDLSLNLDSVPDPLRHWLARMLSRIETRRPANAHEAIESLEQLLADADMAPSPDPGRAHSAAADQDSGIARWQHFAGVFNRMVSLGFPSGAPDHIQASLGAIMGNVEQLAEIGKKAMFHQGSLDDVLTRAREGRKRIADQMDALNLDAKEVRMLLQPLKIAAARHGDKAAAFPAQALELHKQVVGWEGRSGFMEPYKELADAYTAMGALIDKWWAVRSAQLACERDAAENDEKLMEMDGQIDELRQALRLHEANLAEEIAACEHALSELGAAADRIDLELLDLASRFSAPLRSKPELGACFRELSQSRA
jgi:serine/threonine-protein kinase